MIRDIKQRQFFHILIKLNLSNYSVFFSSFSLFKMNMNKSSMFLTPNVTGYFRFLLFFHSYRLLSLNGPDSILCVKAQSNKLCTFTNFNFFYFEILFISSDVKGIGSHEPLNMAYIYNVCVFLNSESTECNAVDLLYIHKT